jgi:hypothetical protein
VVHQALDALHQEQKSLQATCDQALGMVTPAPVKPSDDKLSIRERWRMPIVLGKVARGERLRAPDVKIFDRVKHNLKSQQDVVHVVAVIPGLDVHQFLTIPVSAAPTPVATVVSRKPSALSPKSTRSVLSATTASSRMRAAANAEDAAHSAPSGKKKSAKKRSTSRKPRKKKVGSAYALGASTDGNIDTGGDDAEDGLEEEGLRASLARLTDGMQSIASSLTASFAFLTPAGSMKRAVSTVREGAGPESVETHLDDDISPSSSAPASSAVAPSITEGTTQASKRVITPQTSKLFDPAALAAAAGREFALDEAQLAALGDRPFVSSTSPKAAGGNAQRRSLLTSVLAAFSSQDSPDTSQKVAPNRRGSFLTSILSILGRPATPTETTDCVDRGNTKPVRSALGSFLSWSRSAKVQAAD